MSSRPTENLFTGKIGEEYEMLRLLCPNAALLAERVADAVAAGTSGVRTNGVEIGCGTGVSTLALLKKAANLQLRAIDSAGKMLEQARENLAEWVAQKRVDFVEADALDWLRQQADASVDVVASNYAIHNFTQGYRRDVLAQAFRVLKPGGLFVNGDRYAIDDHAEHLALTQSTLRHWFKVFGELKRNDLLEDWVVHLASDESPDHIMYLAPAVAEMKAIGFANIEARYRDGVDTLMVAVKP